MSALLVFLVGVVVFLLLAFVGIPLAFAFAITGFLGFMSVRGLETALAMLGQAPLQWASDGGLVVVPLFILMGQFAFQSGISAELYTAAYRWMGRLPGGLALATNLACTGFAACTGSSLASGATMASIAYPEMRRFNYSDRLATGCIAAGGTLGILIPPSVVFIIYGFLTEQPIGVLFIAGIIPGVMLSLLFLITIFVMCIIKPEIGPPGEAFSWKEKFASLRGVWGMLLLFLIVIGGLYAGIFAPSEAGAMGALGAFIVALLRRTKLRQLVDALRASLRLTCMTMTILIGAMIFSTFLAVSGIPTLFADWVTKLPISAWGIMILILLIYIPLGMVLDALSMVLLTVPTIYPIISSLGFDPIWFGVVLVLVVEMALVTPPVGMAVYVVHGVTKVPLETVFIGNLPFLVSMILALLLLMAFPQIALILPSAMR